MKKFFITSIFFALLVFSGCNGEKEVIDQGKITSETKGEEQAHLKGDSEEQSGEVLPPLYENKDLEADHEEGDERPLSEVIDTYSSDISVTFSEFEPNSDLETFLMKALEMSEDEGKETRYYYNYVDLDDDGENEIFAVLTGPHTSGTGGSTGLILGFEDGKMHIRQTLTLINTPVIICDDKTDGYKNIVVMREGGGSQSSYVILKAEGGVYEQVSSAPEIEGLKGVKGTAIICEDIAKDLEKDAVRTLHK